MAKDGATQTFINWWMENKLWYIQVMGFPGGSAVKNLPAMQELQESWVWSLGREDPLEEGMATHSSILPWRIPWTEELGRLQSRGSQRLRHDWNNLAQCIYVIEYYSTVRRNEVLVHATAWINCENTEQKKSTTKDHILCDSTDMKCPQANS